MDRRLAHRLTALVVAVAVTVGLGWAAGAGGLGLGSSARPTSSAAHVQQPAAVAPTVGQVARRPLVDPAPSHQLAADQDAVRPVAHRAIGRTSAAAPVTAAATEASWRHRDRAPPATA